MYPIFFQGREKGLSNSIVPAMTTQEPAHKPEVVKKTATARLKPMKSKPKRVANRKDSQPASASELPRTQVVLEYLKQASLSEAYRELQMCDDCFPGLRAMLQQLLDKPRDPAELLFCYMDWQKLATHEALAGAAGLAIIQEFQRQLHGHADNLLASHQPIAARQVLDQFARRGLELTETAAPVATLLEQAKPLYERAYAIHNVNPAQARPLYERAAELAPAHTRLGQDIAQRLAQLP